MKRNFTAAVGAGILSLSMAILPLTLSAQAQTNAQTTPDAGVNTAPTTTINDDRNDFDWGWLGLFGLLGLAGLAGKKRDDEPTRYRDPSATGTATYKD